MCLALRSALSVSLVTPIVYTDSDTTCPVPVALVCRATRDRTLRWASYRCHVHCKFVVVLVGPGQCARAPTSLHLRLQGAGVPRPTPDPTHRVRPVPRERSPRLGSFGCQCHLARAPTPAVHHCTSLSTLHSPKRPRLRLPRQLEAATSLCLSRLHTLHRAQSTLRFSPN